MLQCSIVHASLPLPYCCTCASLGCAELTCVVCFAALLLLLLLLLLQLSFVNGRPTEWNLISEMGTCRESSAACFSLTKVIEAPEPPAANAAAMFKKKASKGGDMESSYDGANDMAENPLHDGEEDDDEDGDMENPLHDENQDDDEEEEL
jgi:hypothetical protein